LRSVIGWTGGQYSIFRGALALYLLVHFLHLAPYAGELFSSEGVLADAADSPLIGLFPNVLAAADSPLFATAFVLLGAALAIPFGIGLWDRAAAVLLWYVWACLLGRMPLISNPGLPYVGWMLLAHAFVPAAPYGSWRARGRPDPRGGWTMPPLIFAAAWLLMAAGYSFSGVTKLVSPSWIDGTALMHVLESPLARPTPLRELMLSLPRVLLQMLTWSLLAFEVLFLPLALVPRLRPFLWLGMLAMHFGIIAFVAFADLTLGMVMLHLFTFQPAWVRPLHRERTEHIFYDGFCGLCHRAVRLVLSEDPSGKSFRMAALQGETFERLVPSGERAGLPDTVIVRREDGVLLVKSAALIYILQRLGGLWRLLGGLLARAPVSLLDVAYDLVAKIRHRIFARPKAACPIVPPDLGARFDP
jgi:predicted DCC family thiol-disulfide oxidoreductase YuxK